MDLEYWSEEAIQEAYESFPHFLYIVWEELRLPNPTDVQIDMAIYLQQRLDRRRILEAFRGVGKSFITCAYIVWRLWRERNLRILIVSASGDRADANARFIKKIITMLPFLAEMKATKDQMDTQNIFEVGGAIADASPSVKSVGITGQITGTRGDIIIADDVEIPKNSATVTQREKLAELVKEFDAILKPGGEILYLGTPQTEASLYNELENRGYKTRIWTVLVPTADEMEDYGDRLAPMVMDMYNNGMQGEPTDPKRFNKTEIAERLRSYGKAGFALQFMLNTNLSDIEKYPLKCSDLIVAALDMNVSSMQWAWSNGVPQQTDLPCTGIKGDRFYSELSRAADVFPYTGSLMTIDPSGRGKDETTYSISKFLGGYIHLMEVDGMLDGYSDMNITRLAMRAKAWGVNQVIVEGNFGDGMFTKLCQPIFRKIHPVGFEEVKHYQQKEIRIIDTLEPVLMMHKLIVNQSVVENDFKRYNIDPVYSLFYQLTRICKERNALSHDDRLDAVAMAVAYWKETMDVSAEEEEAVAIDDWLDAAMGEGLLSQYKQQRRGNNCVHNIGLLRG